MIDKGGRKVPSFFFTNSAGASHGEVLGLMYHFSDDSCSWVFNSFSSVGAIRYGAIEIRAVPG